MKYHHLKKHRPVPVAFWRTVALMFIAMNLFMGLAMLSMSHRIEPRDLVYQVCNESRISATISERGCADLQDQLHMEFLCEQANDRPDNHCWVENKE